MDAQNLMETESYIINLFCKQDDLYESLKNQELTRAERDSIKKQLNEITAEVIKISKYETFNPNK